MTPVSTARIIALNEGDCGLHTLMTQCSPQSARGHEIILGFFGGGEKEVAAADEHGCLSKMQRLNRRRGTGYSLR